MTRHLRDMTYPEAEATPRDRGGLGIHYWRLGSQGPAIDVSDMLVARPRPFALVIWEPLLTKAPSPPKAAPYCCYLRTVIFYHSPYIISPWVGLWRDRHGELRRNGKPGGFVEWDKIETRLSNDDVVLFEGDRFNVGLGRVVWAKRRWWMVHPARRVAA